MTKPHYTSRIDDIITRVIAALPEKAEPGLDALTEQLYRQVPLAELELVTPGQAAALASHAFEFMQTRQKGERKIEIHSPNDQTQPYARDHVVVHILNDDKPFLVDSLSNAFSAVGFTIHRTYHPIIRLKREGGGALCGFIEPNVNEGHRESLMHFEISALPKDMTAEALKTELDRVLQYVNLAIDDWQMMLTKTVGAREALHRAKHFNAQDIRETEEFLDWLMHKNFVFLGYVGVDFENSSPKHTPSINQEELLGISKIDNIPAEVNVAPQLVDMRKASRYSKVHRHALMDVVTVKRFNDAGDIIGEHRFYGLLTSTAYYQSATAIPLVGRKIERLLKRASFSAHSHNGKALVAILQFMPRDELFQIGEDDLFDLSMGVLALESRPGVKLFARTDIPRRYISALAYVPRELFSTDVRLQVTQTLEKHFAATLENYETSIGESALARLHVVFRTSKKTPESLDISSIEQAIATAIMLWSDRLKATLHQRFDVADAERLFQRYVHAFDAAYSSRYPLLSTTFDIEKMEACLAEKRLQIDVYREKSEDRKLLHVKIYNAEEDIVLSDILPKLEHMGLQVVDEFPYTITPSGETSLRMRDIRVRLAYMDDVSLAQIKPNVEELLFKVWNKEAEDDLLNALVFSCGLNVRQIEMVRASVRYLKQVGFPYSREAMKHALLAHPELTTLLVQLFETRFDPSEHDRDNKMAMLSSQIEQGLSHVANLQEDRIISTLHQLIMAMLRTNYYIRGTKGASDVLAIKFDSQRVPNIPLPKPFVEIYVYSAWVEGIHLRGGKVARGGLRWSDRFEDYRTEILGLMKAQMVKNAVIVPVGSKGGFVVKQADPTNRDAYMHQGVECYKAYLRGLLDITDNVIAGEIAPPERVVRHDGDDPYLVVAADKGTASFSDIANGVSADYGFWLDDAFASGGSAGYDHKEMGITARGAWVSVEHHFAQMGHDISSEPFTVVGIGDMSGDVFGNGMLLSKQIKLVAAFNHMHIFLDPDPDMAVSFKERTRLFALPRSGWADYDTTTISKGGGIFARSAKSITISKQMQTILDTDVESCAPDELISLILKAPVDLLWNGGIGTYVKAAYETHEAVGDRANNALRVNGEELRAKVVGEGGNLGLTQPGRIEYARSGGRINTDAIDNSGGVDCSDHEVNIKIALKGPVSRGDMPIDERNAFLRSMTDEVTRLVLKDNQLQTEAISIEQQFSAQRLASHTQLIRALEAKGLLDRSIEYLPSEGELAELKDRKQGLTRPEIAVLLAYSKLALFHDVVSSSMPDEPYFAIDLKRYFPSEMQARFEAEITSHSLKREIIATVATNSMVNRAGVGFYFDILEDTRLPARDIVAAYSLARDVLRMRDIWTQLEEHTQAIEHTQRGEIFNTTSHLLKHVTYWLLRHESLPLSVDVIINNLCKPAKAVIRELFDMITDTQRKPIASHMEALKAQGVEPELAQNIAILPLLHSLPDICSIARRHDIDIADISRVGQSYFSLAQHLRFFQLIKRSRNIATDNRWDRLALQSLVHEFYDELARLADNVISTHQGELAAFKAQQADALGRFTSVMDNILERDTLSSPMLMVALQQLKQVGN